MKAVIGAEIAVLRSGHELLGLEVLLLKPLKISLLSSTMKNVMRSTPATHMALSMCGLTEGPRVSSDSMFFF